MTPTSIGALTTITSTALVLVNSFGIWWLNVREKRRDAARDERLRKEEAERVTVARKVDDAAGTLAAIKDTGEKTHLAVNSNYSELKDELKRANANNDALQRLLGQLLGRAQPLQNGTPSGVLASTPPSPPPAPNKEP